MSDSVRWRTLEDLYQAALKIPPSARVAFLNENCPNELLRREVVSLMEAQPAGDDLLERPVIRYLAQSLPPGTLLGHYRIEECVGLGGMGDVYRATDTKLHRQVAIKILPPAFTDDPVRLARFQREARLLAALNHPNVAQIYGVEESGDLHALVMEFVAGRTISMPQGVDSALRCASQIAEGLEAAHEKGIIHRDLKPGNILVTPEGVVKILDFWLACQPGHTIAGHGAPPRVMTMSSEAGIILGTPAYMSPEQATGNPVDKRTDIWSFGVVLYELLTGTRLFEGETISHSMANVLTRPIEFAGLPPETPLALRNLLYRCLDRDPRRRLRDIGEARIILVDPHLEQAAIGQRGPPKRSIVTALAMIAPLLLLVGAAVSIRYHQAPPEVPAMQAYLLPPENTDFDFGLPYPTPAIAPDGTRIVYGVRTKTGKVQLWMRRIDSLAAQPLPGTENAVTPFWSADSRWVAFGQENKMRSAGRRRGPSRRDGIAGRYME